MTKVMISDPLCKTVSLSCTGCIKEVSAETRVVDVDYVEAHVFVSIAAEHDAGSVFPHKLCQPLVFLHPFCGWSS